MKLIIILITIIVLSEACSRVCVHFDEKKCEAEISLIINNQVIEMRIIRFISSCTNQVRFQLNFNFHDESYNAACFARCEIKHCKSIF